jgi:hypothetical protein
VQSETASANAGKKSSKAAKGKSTKASSKKQAAQRGREAE